MPVTDISRYPKFPNDEFMNPTKDSKDNFSSLITGIFLVSLAYSATSLLYPFVDIR